MKLTKSKLKQLIKEELEATLNELQPKDVQVGKDPNDPTQHLFRALQETGNAAASIIQYTGQLLGATDSQIKTLLAELHQECVYQAGGDCDKYGRGETPKYGTGGVPTQTRMEAIEL
jgi:hypothetical protein